MDIWPTFRGIYIYIQTAPPGKRTLNIFLKRTTTTSNSFYLHIHMHSISPRAVLSSTR